MTDLESPVRYELTRNQIVSLRAGDGLTIACDRGLVWVTADGRRDDYWLPSGDTLFVSRGGRVVIEAAQSSAIAVARQSAVPGIAKLKPRLDRLRDMIVTWLRPTGSGNDAESRCTSGRPRTCTTSKSSVSLRR